MSTDLDVDLDIGAVDVNLNGLDDIRGDFTARLKELAPFIFNVLWKEVPLVRVSAPHRYRLGFCVFGREIWAMTLCGESEILTERNPCPGKAEQDCGDVAR